MKLLPYFLCVTALLGSTKPGSAGQSPHITQLDDRSSNDVISVFPRTVDEMDMTFQQATDEALAGIQKILSLKSEERTFENTVKEFDRIAARFYVPWCAINTLQMVHPNHIFRARAEKIKLAYKEFAIDHLETNRAIYKAFKEYQEGNAQNEYLNAERTHFLNSTLATARRFGLEMDAASFEKMKTLIKQIALLSDQFCTNVSQDHSSLAVTKEDLTGLDDEFISTLQKDKNFYILACDYPTQTKILANCSVASTRKAYYRAFRNRAFPQNLPLLNELVNKRDELAQLLGYDSYAKFDIELEMAKDPSNVANFLEALSVKTREKASREWKLLTQELPESVTLTDGKINPWDEAYLSDQYKQKHLQLNSNDIAKYFPLENTINGMLSIFGQFLDLQFKIVPCQNCWDPSVLLIEVHDSKSIQPLVGHLLLDLFPRENKYSHACCNSIVLPTSNDQGQTYQPALAVIITNFSKPIDSTTSLLKIYEVETLFHEFGHAVHVLLGRAEMPSKGGYYTTMDFVETPSQLFEKWLWDPSILKRVSRHYQTGEPLSDHLIHQLIASEEYEEGRIVIRELRASQISLNCFMPGKNKDLIQIEKKIYENLSAAVDYDPESHALCSFMHLVDYGAKYYSYLWSNEIAVKFFDSICSNGGLLDSTIGKDYREKVIGKGGSCDPELLVKDFLYKESP